jgi:hypothetical protein
MLSKGAPALQGEGEQAENCFLASSRRAPMLPAGACWKQEQAPAGSNFVGVKRRHMDRCKKQAMELKALRGVRTK